MLNALVHYGSDAKSSQLTSQMWERDVPGQFDDVDAKAGVNTGLFNRAKLIKDSKTIDLEGPIMHELFQMDRYILNQVAIQVKFYRSRPEFYLLSSKTSAKYNAKLEEVILRVCKCKINPAVYFKSCQNAGNNICQISLGSF